MNKEMTCQQLADFFTSEVLKGRGQHKGRTTNGYAFVRPPKIHDDKFVFIAVKPIEEQS